MFKTLRILFTLLSALCVAIVLPVGTFLGLTYALICVALAFVFFVLMLYFKGKHEETLTENQTPTVDFLDSPSKNENKAENLEKSDK
ncbi:MAG: hypothetical protein E7343_06425 [Clostridiales bacterium]|nr:hypothetical protein [Clostridiales bacterium]